MGVRQPMLTDEQFNMLVAFQKLAFVMSALRKC